MCRQQNCASRCFVNAARLHADETIFHQVQTANAIVVAQTIEFGQYRGGRHGNAIQGNGVAVLEIDFDVFGNIRRVPRCDGALVDKFRCFFPRVFQHFAFG